MGFGNYICALPVTVALLERKSLCFSSLADSLNTETIAGFWGLHSEVGWNAAAFHDFHISRAHWSQEGFLLLAVVMRVVFLGILLAPHTPECPNGHADYDDAA